jgi:hypothetical protein
MAINTHRRDESNATKIRNKKSLLLSVPINQTNIFNLFAIALFISVLAQEAQIMYFRQSTPNMIPFSDFFLFQYRYHWEIVRIMIFT